MNPWETLGVSDEIAVADLRRRYAALIKEFRPETHPLDFARIREAYEIVLPFARRREAAAAEEAEQGALAIEADAESESESSTSEPDIAADDAPLPEREQPVQVGTAPVIVASTRDATAAPDVEPALAQHWREFHALAESVQGTHDDALLPALRILLQARACASLDDSQALEFVLLRWFIESESPPLTLLFASGRAFDWHTHVARLSNWLSPWALRQMEARLVLSRDYVYARHFSGNPWLRRLHSPGKVVMPIASRAATLEAVRWADRWQHLSDDAGAQNLANALNARALRRIRGSALLTTDLLAGIVVACAAPDLADAIVYAGTATAVIFALRLLVTRARSAPRYFRPVRAIAQFLSTQWPVAAIITIVMAFASIALLQPADAGGLSLAAGALLVLPALALVLRLLWGGLSWLECCGAELLAWRAAVDRLEFGRFVDGREAPAETAPFGTRLSMLARWKAIAAARRFERVEVATRARPARPAVFKRLIALRRPTRGRALWLGAWALFMLLRVLHAFYSGN
jgi:hypothetical protein